MKPLQEQPESREFHLADGVFIKSMHLRCKGALIPQHAHDYDHHSMLAVGAVRVTIDGVWMEDAVAPKAIFIQAGVKHLFEALTDEVLIYCIHNVSRTGDVSIKEEHQIVKD